MKKYKIRTVWSKIPLIHLSIIAISLYMVIQLFSSCESFIEVELPSSQLTAEAVFTEEATAIAAMAAVYAAVRDNGIMRDLHYEMSLYSDELEYFGSAVSSEEQFYTNSLIPSHQTVKSWWNSSYSQIYAANAVIKGLENSSDLSEGIKEQLKGEALLVRGLIHFYLAALYGDIPYIRTTDYQQNTTVSRNPKETVYGLAIEDLTIASDLLEQEYPLTNRTRPNTYVAMATLARVYGYAEQWENAEMAATAVIGQSTLYPWTVGLEDVFLKDSKTTIWQWSPRGSNVNTWEAIDFIFETAPPPQVALTESLIGSFEAGDLRLNQWVREVTNGTESFYHAFKYKTRGNTDASVEYSILLRLSEQYLIRSEARAQLGDLEEAANDLNKVRNRAGLANAVYSGKDELLQLIWEERRHELFTEAGHRFFDLKRTQRLDEVLGDDKIGWHPTDRTLPLPEDELLINPNLLPQNPGY